MKRLLSLFSILLAITAGYAQTVDYSVVAVKEESGLNLKKISVDNDYITMPTVKRRGQSAEWWTGRVIAIMPNEDKLAYLSSRNNSTNVYLKRLSGNGTALQRTKRSIVLNFSISPDGKKIVFAEADGKTNRTFITNADKGYVCRQVTNGERDFSPVYSPDMKTLFLARSNKNKSSEIWSYNMADNSLSFITPGADPTPIPKTTSLLCTRYTGNGLGEIWRVNYETGEEECVVSDVNRSFASPLLSPDGKWILMVGTNVLKTNERDYTNTDIFVARADGTNLAQLTYHAADDVSPVWSNDGKYIYFVSQRGSSTATANVWRMDFLIK